MGAPTAVGPVPWVEPASIPVAVGGALAPQVLQYAAPTGNGAPQSRQGVWATEGVVIVYSPGPGSSSFGPQVNAPLLARI